MTARRERLLLAVTGLVPLLALAVAIYRPWGLADGFLIGAPFGRDFANFWLGGHFALTRQLDVLIDVARYNEILRETLAYNNSGSFVFSYPPHILLFLAPFGALPFDLALGLWTALNLVCIAAATLMICRNWVLAAAAVFSPAALTMASSGHFGGALALAAVFVLMRGKQQPVLAGICLAAMSVKPHVAAVIGFVLLCAGYWRALAWSVPAGMFLLAASVAAFGLQPWIDYIAWTVPFHAQLISQFHVGAIPTAISFYAGLAMLGIPLWLAHAIQYAFGALVLWRVIVLFRRNGPDAATLALVLLAALMALPYVNSYDLAITVPALTPAVFQGYPERPFLPLIPAMVLWLAPLFALPFGLLGLPIVPLGVAAVLVLALIRSAPPQAGGFAPAATAPPPHE